MEIIKCLNYTLFFVFFICYFYQFVMMPVPILSRRKKQAPLLDGDAPKHTFAVLICARNESAVIADIIKRIKAQTYDPSLITVFVMADNCTDNTAEIAAREGAVVYERFNTSLVGKGYALDALLTHIKKDYPDGFDGYFVFDADNILDSKFIEKMNVTFSAGYDIVTSYRNSKNYGQNWITSGYALWFLRESRYLNHARMLLSTSCAVSGTGFLFSRRILEKMGGWPFHTLIEDIEFTVYNVVDGEKIGINPDAIVYDEQPMTFRQSWRQRLRWSRGYLQIYKIYGLKLIRGIFSGSFACYDMNMAIMPAFIVAVCTLVINIAAIVAAIVTRVGYAEIALSCVKSLFGAYMMFFVVGAVTTITEWERICTSAAKKILYTFTFPLFMFTYIPITFAALFKKVTWLPIEHTVSIPSGVMPIQDSKKVLSVRTRFKNYIKRRHDVKTERV